MTLVSGVWGKKLPLSVVRLKRKQGLFQTSNPLNLVPWVRDAGRERSRAFWGLTPVQVVFI